MPLWDRLFTKNSKEDPYTEIAANAIRDLGEGVDPRRSEAVGEALGWLWPLEVWNSHRSEALYRVLSVPGVMREDFDQFVLRSLHLPAERPDTLMDRYAAVAEAVRALIESALTTRPSPNTGLQEEVIAQAAGLREAIRIVGRLKMTEVHEEICRLCAAANRSRRPVRTTLYYTATSVYVDLYHEATSCLSALPPDAVPGFWKRLKALSTSEDLWPAIRQMKDRRAVPYLLDSLPALIPDGQSHIINTLGNLRDTRAVPALQEIAADPANLLAPMAAHALNEILRRSQDDAAQLLRPTDARYAGNAGDTLLRPAGAGDATAHPDELLRADLSQRTQPAQEEEGTS